MSHCWPRSDRALAILRYVWAGPVTLLGLLFVAAARVSGGSSRLVRGVIEAEGGLVARLLNRALPGWPIAAITLGHVVLATDAATLGATRPHERVHVAQYTQWGPLLPVLYLASSLTAWSRGGSAYHDNYFERQASSRASESTCA